MLDVPREMLRKAIDLWLACAYPSGEVPEAVQGRIALDASRPVPDLLNDIPFERYATNAPFPCTAYALRLGSTDYPHLKLEIRPFPNRLGFLFWVNTHDQFIPPDPRCRDAQRWRQVVESNRALKQSIEQAWAEQGLPTFVSTMREDQSA